LYDTMMILRVAAVCIWQSPRRLLGATCHSDIAYEHSINTLEQLICLSFVSMPRLHETYCISIQVRGTKNHRKPFENCRKSRWCVAIESRSTCLPIPTILVQTSTDANASWIGRVDLHPKKDPSQTETFASSEPFFTLHFKHAYPHLNTTAIESFVTLRQALHLRQAILTVRPVARLIASQLVVIRAGVASQYRPKVCF
jgi:hypothetical protein